MATFQEDIDAIKAGMTTLSGVVQTEANALTDVTKTINDFIAQQKAGGAPTAQQLADLEAAGTALQSSAGNLQQAAHDIDQLAVSSDPGAPAGP